MRRGLAARPVIVTLSSREMSLDETTKVLGEVLGRLGCGGCYSGFDIWFRNEVDFVVNARGGVVPATPQLQEGGV